MIQRDLTERLKAAAKSFPAVTVTFNLAPGVALGDATEIVEQVALDLRMPPSPFVCSIHGAQSSALATAHRAAQPSILTTCSGVASVFPAPCSFPVRSKPTPYT